MKKSITARWLVNTFGVMLVVVVLLIVVLSFVMSNYYYNGVHQTLNGRVDELSNIFGLSENAVRKRRYAALRKMQRMLEEWFEPSKMAQ